MTRDRWAAIDNLFHAARGRDRAARAAYLASACGGDEALRAEVEALLAAEDSREGFLDAGAAPLAARLVGTSLLATAAGRRLGAYEIGPLLGAGGMGEVYRGRDTRIGRDVAVKVLPAAYTADPERLVRFQREARALGSLNHPNVAAIYGLEEGTTADGQRIDGLIMELVEGETLAERLAVAGRLPVAEALSLAEQMADALDAAHDKGVVHRDLKPANIKRTPDGRVKVLDFGLATMTAAADDASATQCTRDGEMLGTAAYMSPEQARGQAVDKRTDIWAFGCVLFEMLAGRAAFVRATVPDTLAAVLEQEPDWRSLPSATPHTIVTLLKRCLAKDRGRRLRDIGDARLEIAEARQAPIGAPHADETAPARRRPERPVAGLLAMAAVTALSLGTAWWAISRGGGSSAVETRFEIMTSPTPTPASLAVSADGRNIAFVADRNGTPVLWVRNLGGESNRPLEGTEGGSLPFWSPDGTALGFFAGGKLRRIDVDAGTAQTLADAPNPQGGAWPEQDTIIFSPHQVSPLVRVAAGGGDLTPVTRLAAGHLGHAFPQVLAGGERLLYYALGSPESGGVHVSRLDGSAPRRLADISSPAVYAPSGHLLFARNDALVAQPFDASTGALSGTAVPIAKGIVRDGTAATSLPAVAASPSGTIVFRDQASGRGRQLTWFDRTGRVVSRIGAVDDARTQSVIALSPDGRQVAVHRDVEGNRDIWLLDLTRNGAMTRITFDPAQDIMPTWTRDGGLLFGRTLAPLAIFHRRAVHVARDELLLKTTQHTAPADISPDGRVLLYLRADPATLLDIWALPLESGGESYPLIRTSFEEMNPRFDPSGDWVAYQSAESGRFEVYLKRFDGTGAVIAISTTGGTQPRWRADGRELFFISLDQQLMATPLERLSRPPFLAAGVAAPIFPVRVGGQSGQRQYEVTPDGQRFLMDVQVDGTPTPLTVIQHWGR